MYRFNKKQVLSVAVSVAVSMFAVALIASATTYIDTASVAVATDTPGAAVSVKGAAIFEGFVRADYFTSTSTGNSWLFGNLGLGTTTPGTRLDVAGFVNVKGNLNIAATSTLGDLNATSTVTVGTSSPTAADRLTVDGMALVAGHVESQGKPPVLSSCGTAPSVIGTDQTGKITIGSSANAAGTACIATFVNPWRNAPTCVIANETSNETIMVVSSATAMTLKATTTPSAYVIGYHCWGFK